MASSVHAETRAQTVSHRLASRLFRFLAARAGGWAGEGLEAAPAPVMDCSRGTDSLPRLFYLLFMAKESTASFLLCLAGVCACF